MGPHQTCMMCDGTGRPSPDSPDMTGNIRKSRGVELCRKCLEKPGACRCAAEGVGCKFDAAKLRYDLVDPAALKALVQVLSYGAAKYAPDNWRKVEEPQARYYAAAMRHLEAWRAGEACDPDTGFSHLAHALCNLHFLVALRDEPK